MIALIHEHQTELLVIFLPFHERTDVYVAEHEVRHHEERPVKLKKNIVCGMENDRDKETREHHLLMKEFYSADADHPVVPIQEPPPSVGELFLQDRLSKMAKAVVVAKEGGKKYMCEC